jgi:hypothetical protein
MKLSKQQVGQIEAYILQNNIRISSLREDLLDHLCCSVEEKIKTGNTFCEAFRLSIKELAPFGLEEIERETITMLNSKNIPMKKVMYAIGLASTVSMASGLTFSILHMPGGFELLNSGLLFFVFVFLPMGIYNAYKLGIKRTTIEKTRLAFGFLSAAFAVFAGLFKMMHYPGVDELLLTATVIFSFGFLPCLFYIMYVKSVRLSEQEFKES